MLIDDFADSDLISRLGTPWRVVSDQVMGGFSSGLIVHDMIGGRGCLHLSGEVRLDNQGGFIQAALDLTSSGETVDATHYAGVRITVRGNDQIYSVHLRTVDTIRPWQSYRTHFTAGAQWETMDLPFATFSPHRVTAPLDITHLRRIGLVAIGRAFHADLAISDLHFYRRIQV